MARIDRWSRLAVPLFLGLGCGVPAAPKVLRPFQGAPLRSATPIFSGTAEPGSRVTLTIDQEVAGRPWADVAGSWDFTPTSPLREGVHVVSAEGIAGSSSPDIEFFIDTIAPADPVVLEPADGSTVTTGSPIIWVIAEANTTVSLFVDGAAAEGRPVTDTVWRFMPTSVLDDGVHLVSAWSLDRAANENPRAGAVSFTSVTVDPAAPEVLAPAAGATVTTRSLTIAGTAKWGSTVTVMVDGTVAGTALAEAGWWTLTPAEPMDDGLHQLTARSTDPTGHDNPSSRTVSFTVFTAINQVPLAPIIQAPTEGSTAEEAFPVIRGQAQPGMVVAIRLDGQAVGYTVADYAGAWWFRPVLPLDAGVHIVSASARNGLGADALTGPESATVHFAVGWRIAGPDVIPISITAPGKEAIVFGQMPLIMGTTLPFPSGSTPIEVRLKLDDSWAVSVSALNTGDWRFQVPHLLEFGPHHVTAEVEYADVTYRDAVDFTVARVPAQVQVRAPAEGSTVRPDGLTISGTAFAGMTSVGVWLDGARAVAVPVNPDGTWSFTPSPILKDGFHAVTVTVDDSAIGADFELVHFQVASADRGYYDSGCSAAPGYLAPWALLLAGIRCRRWRSIQGVRG